MKILTIQPNGNGNPLSPIPYPWYVDEAGKVLRQEFWNGDPSHLIGFAPADNVYELKVCLKEVFAKGVHVINNLLPVFSTSAGTWATFTNENGYTYNIDEGDSK